MINFGNVTGENTITRNSNLDEWTISDGPYRILIIGCSESGNVNLKHYNDYKSFY